ncbi:MAG TPA: copper resistance system multicopper oxidase, partial [Spongiibacteraceae bacterium]|nr:copper resistance system multicopper oxidase [Spongiibacteraceae bacterium]
MRVTQPHLNTPLSAPVSRRKFVTGISAGGAIMGLGLQHSALAGGGKSPADYRPPQILRGNQFDLGIGYQ